MATESWGSLRRQKPLTEAQVAMYQRLMDAEEALEPARLRTGVGEATFGEMLDVAEAEREHDLYLATVKRFVEALGGRLEVRAVFGEEVIALPADASPGRSGGDH